MTPLLPSLIGDLYWLSYGSFQSGSLGLDGADVSLPRGGGQIYRITRQCVLAGVSQIKYVQGEHKK